MVFVVSLWVPILLSAVIVFVGEFHHPHGSAVPSHRFRQSAH